MDFFIHPRNNYQEHRNQWYFCSIEIPQNNWANFTFRKKNRLELKEDPLIFVHSHSDIKYNHSSTFERISKTYYLHAVSTKHLSWINIRKMWNFGNFITFYWSMFCDISESMRSNSVAGDIWYISVAILILCKYALAHFTIFL